MVSVIMPVYNAAAYVEEAVRSICEQTFRDFELIVIDDGSTDESGAILDRLANEDARIRVHRKPHAGLAVWLNEGLRLAAASLVARMDADDIALPDRLALQVEYMNSHPGVAVLGTAFEYLDQERATGIVVRYPTNAAATRLAMRTNCAVAHPSVMFRKDSVLAVGGYRGWMLPAEDYDLWLRILEVGDIVSLPEVLLRYRVHSGQISVRRVVDQGIRTLAARVAAVRRSRGMQDPFPEGSEVSREEIASLGITPPQIGRAVIRAFGGRYVLMQELCRIGEAKTITEEMFAWIDEHEPAQRRYAQCRLRLLDGFVRWKRGERISGLIAAMSAVARYPVLGQEIWAALRVSI